MKRKSTPMRVPPPETTTNTLSACKAFLDSAEGGLRANPELAIRNFDAEHEAGGSIEAVVIEGKDAIAVTIRYDDQERRTPRLFDPEGFVTMRLLTAFGGRFRFNETGKSRTAKYTDARGLFYPALHHPPLAPNLSLLRIVADGPDNKTVKQRRNIEGGASGKNHRDMRRANLYLTPTRPNKDGKYPEKRTSRGRSVAVQAALAALKSAQAPIAEAHYTALLSRAFELLDALPFSTTK